MRHDNATHKNCHETRQIEAFGKNIGQIGANSQHRQFKSGKVTQFRVFEELKRKIVGEIKKQEILRFFYPKISNSCKSNNCCLPMQKTMQMPLQQEQIQC